MTSLLWKRKTTNRPTVREAVIVLRSSMERLDARIADLEKQIDGLRSEARVKSRTNKKMAMFSLKKSKTCEVHLARLMGMRSTMETNIMNLENAELSQSIVEALRVGSHAMRSVEGLNIDRVDDTMDEVSELMETAREISEALAQSVGDVIIDESELEAELADLEAESVRDSLYFNNSTPAPAQTYAPPAAPRADEFTDLDGLKF